MVPMIRTKQWVCVLAGCVVLVGLWVANAGDLEPPGPPAPTLEHLIRLDDLPLTITASGTYLFAEDISTAGGGITISVDNVTVDLRGFTIDGGIGDGIVTSGVRKNIAIKDGTVRGWSADGVDLSTATNSQVINVRAEANSFDGIKVATGSLVSGCTSTANLVNGITVSGTGGTIVDSSASSNGAAGINLSGGAWSVSSCSALLNTGTGIGGSAVGVSILGCTARDNNGDGFSLGSGGTIVSSSAYSNGDSVGDDGIVGGGNNSIINCTATGNFEDGIEVASGSFVRGNNSRSNLSSGINVTGSDNRIEENNVTLNSVDGIKANPATGNFVIRNSGSGNVPLEFDIGAGNSYGQIAAGAAGFIDHNSWANYAY